VPPATLDWDRFTGRKRSFDSREDWERPISASSIKREQSTNGWPNWRRQRLQMREDLFARNIRMLRLELEAWIEHVEGKEDAAVSLMREAGGA
jgi:hypothetical protein